MKNYKDSGLKFKHEIKVEGGRLFLTVELEVYNYKKDLVGKPKFFTNKDALDLVLESGHSINANTSSIALMNPPWKKVTYNDGRSPNKNTWEFELKEAAKPVPVKTKTKTPQTPEKKQEAPKVEQEKKPTNPPKPKQAKQSATPSTSSTLDALKNYKSNKKG